MATPTKTWLLNTTDACGNITTGINEKVIVDAIDDYKWMIGKRLSYVLHYLKREDKFIELKELTNN